MPEQAELLLGGFDHGFLHACAALRGRMRHVVLGFDVVRNDDQRGFSITSEV